MHNIIYYILLLLQLIGFARIEIESASNLFLFYKVLFCVLVVGITALNILKAEYSYYIYSIPVALSISLNVYKKLRYS